MRIQTMKFYDFVIKFLKEMEVEKISSEERAIWSRFVLEDWVAYREEQRRSGNWPQFLQKQEKEK